MKAPLALVIAAIALPAQAEIFRCTAGGGAVTYQEIPCPESAPGRPMGHIPGEFPAVNHAERNRLLQREAALDARMLERERIESAERIARNELAVREREAKAARAAAEAAAGQNFAPVYAYGPPYGPPRVMHHRIYFIRGAAPQRM